MAAACQFCAFGRCRFKRIRCVRWIKVSDTLECIISRLPNYFKCVWNCECYVPYYTICWCLLILGTVVATKIAQ